MEFRIFGALLIVAGFSASGFMISRTQKTGIFLLEELICTLDNLICELEYRRTPLPELCRTVAKNRHSRLNTFFYKVAEEMDSQVNPNVSACVQAALAGHGDLPETVQTILRRLGESLGRFDIEGEILSLQSLRAETAEKLNDMRITQKEKAKTNRTLWVCAGALAAVLMM